MSEQARQGQQAEQVRTREQIMRGSGRRGLIAGAAALAAAGLAKAVTPSKVEAADNGALLLGNSNTAQSATWISRDTAGDGAGTNCLIAISADTNGNGFLGYGKGSGQGVIGAALGSGYGVSASSSGGSAIFADSTGNGFSYGLHARATGLFGILGVGAGATTAAGIRGQGGMGSGDGVQGIAANGDGIYGYATTGTGVRADSTSGTAMHAVSESGVGAIGSSQSATGVYGYSAQSSGVYGLGATYGVWGKSANGAAVFGQATGTGIGVYGAAAGPGSAGHFEGNVFITGNMTVLGAKSAAVKGADGGLRRVYCVEMPESYFEDTGRAKLAAGQATVTLEREFAAIVKSDDYEVFLTPYGDCKGLYVGKKGAGGFTVGELQGGKADVEFAYRVLAKRKDIAGARLEKVAGPDAARLAEMAKKELPAPKAREPKKHLELPAFEAPKLTEMPAGQRPGPQPR